MIVRATTAKPSNIMSAVSKSKKKLRERETSTLPQLSTTSDWCIKVRATTPKPSNIMSAVSKSKKKLRETEASTLP